MRPSRHVLTNEELAALIASSAYLPACERASLREMAGRWLKRLAERIAGHKLP